MGNRALHGSITIDRPGGYINAVYSGQDKPQGARSKSITGTRGYNIRHYFRT